MADEQLIVIIMEPDTMILYLGGLRRLILGEVI